MFLITCSRILGGLAIFGVAKAERLLISGFMFSLKPENYACQAFSKKPKRAGLPAAALLRGVIFDGPKIAMEPVNSVIG
jgi:hypothetical protein